MTYAAGTVVRLQAAGWPPEMPIQSPASRLRCVDRELCGDRLVPDRLCKGSDPGDPNGLACDARGWLVLAMRNLSPGSKNSRTAETMHIAAARRLNRWRSATAAQDFVMLSRVIFSVPTCRNATPADSGRMYMPILRNPALDRTSTAASKGEDRVAQRRTDAEAKPPSEIGSLDATRPEGVLPVVFLPWGS